MSPVWVFLTKADDLAVIALWVIETHKLTTSRNELYDGTPLSYAGYLELNILI